MEQMRLTARRGERTDDAAKLARHLEASIQEIADTAAGIDKGDLDRTQTALRSLYHQLGNATSQVDEHIQAITDAKKFREPVEFDVIPEG